MDQCIVKPVDPEQSFEIRAGLTELDALADGVPEAEPVAASRASRREPG